MFCVFGFSYLEKVPSVIIPSVIIPSVIVPSVIVALFFVLCFLTPKIFHWLTEGSNFYSSNNDCPNVRTSVYRMGIPPKLSELLSANESTTVRTSVYRMSIQQHLSTLLSTDESSDNGYANFCLPVGHPKTATPPRPRNITGKPWLQQFEIMQGCNKHTRKTTTAVQQPLFEVLSTDWSSDDTCPNLCLATSHLTTAVLTSVYRLVTQKARDHQDHETSLESSASAL